MQLPPPLRRFAIALATLAALGAAAADAAPFTGLVVFGDSLSDSGNNASAGLYNPGQVVTDNTYVGSFAYGPAGTYSNGPVWASYLAAELALPLTPSFDGGRNYANGGATTGTPGILFGFPYSLKSQAKTFLKSVDFVAPANSLYVVAGGGNNARDALEQIMALDLASAAGRAEAKSIIRLAGKAVLKDLSDIVNALLLTGGQNVVVWNMPDLGLAPYITDPNAKAIATYLTGIWSDAIEATFAAVPGASVFDLYGFSAAVAADPLAYGFVNVTDACGAAPAGTDCDTYLWWDGVHPTTRTHSLLAAELAALVVEPAPTVARLAAAPSRFLALAPAEVPEPSSLLLIAAGAAAVAASRARRGLSPAPHYRRNAVGLSQPRDR